jgi:hypothetical protein
MAKEKHICVSYNKPSAEGASGVVSFYVNRDRFKCTSNATVFEDGKWYCKRHSPSAKKAREEKSWETYMARIRRNLERNK